MDITGGLIALDSYYKAGDARREREYLQARRDAELSLLPDKIEADRSGYVDTTEENRARQTTRPQRTANEGARLGIESADLAARVERQPMETKTARINAEMGLSNAEAEMSNLPSTQETRSNQVRAQALQSKADLDLLPQKIRAATVQGMLSEQGQRDIVVGTLGQLIARQDKAGALRFANSIAGIPDILPGTNGKPLSDIVPVRRGQTIGKDANGQDIQAQGDGYMFVTADGQSFFNPVETIRAAMDKIKTGEYQFIHDNFGNVFAGNKTTGTVTQTHRGDPALRRSANSPADVQSAEWLMANVPKFRSNPELAWDAVRSSKEKTRSSFIMDYVSKNAIPGQDARKIADDAGRIYDELRKTYGSAPSNSGAQGTLGGGGGYDPRINSLIGVPSQ